MAVNEKLLVLVDYLTQRISILLLVLLFFKPFECRETGEPSLQKGNNNQALLEQNQ